MLNFFIQVISDTNQCTFWELSANDAETAAKTVESRAKILSIKPKKIKVWAGSFQFFLKKEALHTVDSNQKLADEWSRKIRQ